MSVNPSLKGLWIVTLVCLMSSYTVAGSFGFRGTDFHYFASPAEFTSAAKRAEASNEAFEVEAENLYELLEEYANLSGDKETTFFFMREALKLVNFDHRWITMRWLVDDVSEEIYVAELERLRGLCVPLVMRLFGEYAQNGEQTGGQMLKYLAIAHESQLARWNTLSKYEWAELSVQVKLVFKLFSLERDNKENSASTMNSSFANSGLDIQKNVKKVSEIDREIKVRQAAAAILQPNAPI